MSDIRRVLSICTGMGLLDRAFMDAGFHIVAGCEIDAEKRAMYEALMGHTGSLADRLGRDAYYAHDLKDLVKYPPAWTDGIIGGPSCQSHSRPVPARPRLGQPDQEARKDRSMTTNTDNASGAGMERCLRCRGDLLHMPDQGNYCCCLKPLLFKLTLADASRLLAEKEGELQRMRSAAQRVCDATLPGKLAEKGILEAINALRAALKP